MRYANGAEAAINLRCGLAISQNMAWQDREMSALHVLFGAKTERLMSSNKRFRKQGWHAKFASKSSQRKKFDPAEQLRIVERAVFSSKPLLNRGETRLLRVLEDACALEAPGWRVMAQVSLGEILGSHDQEAYRAINSKRVDLLLIGPDGHARHAIELQGSGHRLGPAATRDAIKKEALRRAGVGYMEVVVGDTPADVRVMVAKLARRERGVVENTNLARIDPEARRLTTAS